MYNLHNLYAYKGKDAETAPGLLIKQETCKRGEWMHAELYHEDADASGVRVSLGPAVARSPPLLKGPASGSAAWNPPDWVLRSLEYQRNKAESFHWKWCNAGASLSHPLSPQSPEASVGLHVLRRPDRSLAVLHVCVTVNWGAAAGRVVISFFRKRQKTWVRWTDGGADSSDLLLLDFYRKVPRRCVVQCVVHVCWSLDRAHNLVQLIGSKLKQPQGLSLMMMWAADAQTCGRGHTGSPQWGMGGAGWVNVVQQTRERVCLHSLSCHPAALRNLCNYSCDQSYSVRLLRVWSKWETWLCWWAPPA